MTPLPAASVDICTCPDDVPSVPAWFAEVILLARHFTQRGVLAAISEHVRLARGRAGHYDVIDFVAVLLGYALSGEPTLEAFFDRLQPFAGPFMALFGRDRLPHRSTLSRFLADVDVACLEAVRQQFAHDLCQHGFSGDLLGGLVDHSGHHLLIFDVDGTRQAARQRALVTAAEFPHPRRRLAYVCAPGYLGRKRGEVVRTRTTVLQAHTQQWLGTFSGAGNGDYGAELDAACRVIVTYLHAKGRTPAQALLRLDALYGNASPLARVQRAGLGFVTRGRDYQLLDHPKVRARLAQPCDGSVQHPGTQVRRELFDAGYITDWLAPVPDLALTCRVIVARQAAPPRTEELTNGKLRDGFVYELFLTTAPVQCLHAKEVVDLYFQRGGFEQVLSDEDAEQDPDRWCSWTPHGQEFWQILSQWVWNTRLELGQVAHESGLRMTSWQDTASSMSLSSVGPTQEVPMVEQPPPEPVVEQYGPLELARDWGRRIGRFTGHAFEVLENGTLSCPAEKILRPQERRTAADGTLRIVYRARKEDCRSCALARDCLGRQASGAHPRRVSAVRKRVVQADGARAALIHEQGPSMEQTLEQAELLWCDLPGYRIRHAYITRLRRQRVTVVQMRVDGSAAVQTAAPQLWTRAERVHRRLSWVARLTRNQCAAGPPRYALTVFGVAPTLASHQRHRDDSSLRISWGLFPGETETLCTMEHRCLFSC